MEGRGKERRWEREIDRTQRRGEKERGWKEERKGMRFRRLQKRKDQRGTEGREVERMGRGRGRGRRRERERWR